MPLAVFLKTDNFSVSKNRSDCYSAGHEKTKYYKTN